MILDFVLLVLLTSLIVNFLRTLAEKWGFIEWAQINAPNDFFYKLASCAFCQSFWIAFVLCTILAIVTGEWYLMAIPVFSCNIQW
jgi:hypothetical protein